MKCSKKVISFIAAIFLFIFAAMPAYATDSTTVPDEGSAEDDSATTYSTELNADDFVDDAKQFKTYMNDIYTFVLYICIPLGAVNIAVGAFQIMFAAKDEAGYEKAVQKGKTKILYTFIAWACLALLPYVVTWAADLFKSVQWSPGASISTG